MTALDDSRSHLTKAREFLQAARFNLEMQLYNAATSDAVVSGINSKDAICLRVTGRTRKTDDHRDAVNDVKAVGPIGAAAAPTLSRLLKLKTKSQYQPSSMSAFDAGRAVEWAERLLASAEQVVTDR